MNNYHLVFCLIIIFISGDLTKNNLLIKRVKQNKINKNDNDYQKLYKSMENIKE